MTKTELVARMAEASGLSKADSAKALEAFLLTVTDAMKERQIEKIQPSHSERK